MLTECPGRLTFASRFALARRFLSHTMTCTGGPVPLPRHKQQSVKALCMSAKACRVKEDKRQGTCCSVALPACCTAAVSSGVGLDCPELKCCSSKLICAWLGFHLGLYASQGGSELGQSLPRDSDCQRAWFTLALLPNAALAVDTVLTSCGCRFREEQTSR